MTTHRRKKVRKYRGSKTHGCGSMKKRRGAGHRGGRGNAGSGKRADTNKPTTLKDPLYFGKRGFTPKNTTPVFAVDLRYFQQTLDQLVSRQLASEKSGLYTVDLVKLGYHKLLGGTVGKFTAKVHFITEYASAGAIEKVQQAGGKVEVTHPAEDLAEETAEGAGKTEKISSSNKKPTA